MNILRWLIQHPVVLAWVLAAIAIILNFSGAGKDSTQEAQHAPQAEQQAPAAASATTPAAPQQQQQAAPAPVAISQTPAAPQVPSMSAIPVAAVAPTAPAQQITAPAAQPATPAQPITAQATPAAADPTDLLRRAREALWNNDLDNAEKLYAELVKQSPNSVEYKGELANFYWKQGKAREASELFVEIAPQLIEQGRKTEVVNMKLYVDMVDPALAQRFDAVLTK